MASTSNPTSNTFGVKMPQIRIVQFDGQYENWPEFRDLFSGLMKKYKGDECERIFHLKNWLVDEPKQLIQHIAVQNGNFDEAWRLLTERYENTSAIVDSHLKSLFSLEIISHESSVTIRNAISTTKSCLSALKNLKIDTSSWDPVIVYLLRDRLNLHLRSKWEEERKGSHEVPTLTAFLAFLEIRYNILASFPQRKVNAKNVSTQRHNDAKILTATTSPVDNGSVTDDEVDNNQTEEVVLLNNYLRTKKFAQFANKNTAFLIARS